MAASLSGYFNLNTGIASAIVDYGIGELVETRVSEMGVTPYFKRFEHKGVNGPNIATVYSYADQRYVGSAPLDKAAEVGSYQSPA